MEKSLMHILVNFAPGNIYVVFTRARRNGQRTESVYRSPTIQQIGRLAVALWRAQARRAWQLCTYSWGVSAWRVTEEEPRC